MRSAQSAAGSGVGDEGPSAAAGVAHVLMDGGRAPVTVSGDGRDSGVLLLGLGTAILTVLDPCGAVGGERKLHW